jgi:hypothetical protein
LRPKIPSGYIPRGFFLKPAALLFVSNVQFLNSGVGVRGRKEEPGGVSKESDTQTLQVKGGSRK